jgi:hypothetical protein
MQQDWYHLHKPSVNPLFRPYVPDALPSTWFRISEKRRKAHHMWEMWFIHYMHVEQVYCVYSNLATYNGDNESCLSVNRREPGLHYNSKGREDLCKLLRVWRKDFIVFPTDVVRLHWDASVITDRPYWVTVQHMRILATSFTVHRPLLLLLFATVSVMDELCQHGITCYYGYICQV